MGRRGLAVVLGAAAGLALAILVTSATQRPPGGTAPRSAFTGSVIDHVPAPRVALHDERGRPVRLRALRGRPVVVAFMTAACHDTCPLMAQQIRGALDRVDGDVPALAVAVDPRADTPARARAFLRRQRVAGRLRFALGTAAELAPVWRGFAVQPQLGPHGHGDAGGRLAHQARIVLLDRRGIQRVGYSAADATPQALAHDLRVLLDEPRPSVSHRTLGTATPSGRAGQPLCIPPIRTCPDPRSGEGRVARTRSTG